MKIFVGLFLLVMTLFSVELKLDTVYEGPLKLSVSQLGVSMGLPASWQGVAHKGEGLILSQKESNDTMTLRSKTLNAQGAVAYLNTTHYLKNGVKIFPQDRIKKISSYIFRRAYSFNARDSNQLLLLYIIVGSHNRAVLMTVRYDSSSDTKIKATSMNIVQALSFTPTRILKNAQQGLESRLKGIHVVYLKRDGAYDDKRELWLCSNGRYQLNEDRVIAGGMSRSKETVFGSWSVENSQLILRRDDGLEHLITLTRKNTALLFDGYRSYELKNNQCQ